MQDACECPEITYTPCHSAARYILRFHSMRNKEKEKNEKKKNEKKKTKRTKKRRSGRQHDSSSGIGHLGRYRWHFPCTNSTNLSWHERGLHFNLFVMYFNRCTIKIQFSLLVRWHAATVSSSPIIIIYSYPGFLFAAPLFFRIISNSARRTLSLRL